LADLRQKVPDPLSIGRHGVAFDRAAPHGLDLEAFHEQISRATGLSYDPLMKESAPRSCH
jgi:hypothetical protein